MKVYRTVSEYQTWRNSLQAGKTVGFVPTMGALHDGHGSLLNRSRIDNEYSVLSIFVNPTQFNNPEDFKNYPNTLELDLKKAEAEKVDIVFLPDYKEMYADNYRYRVSENDFSYSLCGANRPGHFNGVLTVVMKLLNIIRADSAYFGEKDYQQLALIKDMVQFFFVPTTIISCATIREKSGLAMSSRNKRLTADELSQSAIIYQSISQEKTAEAAKQRIQDHGFKVEYIVDYQNRRYAAVQVGTVRLIDNVEI